MLGIQGDIPCLECIYQLALAGLWRNAGSGQTLLSALVVQGCRRVTGWGLMPVEFGELVCHGVLGEGTLIYWVWGGGAMGECRGTASISSKVGGEHKDGSHPC